MIKILIAIVVLVVIQFALIYANLKVDVNIEVIKNINWWLVFTPTYIAILVYGFFKFVLSGMSM